MAHGHHHWKRETRFSRLNDARPNIHDDAVRSCREQVKDDAPPALQAVRLMAQYLSDPAGSRDIVIETLKTWLGDASSCNNPTVQLLAAAVFTHEGDLKDAVRTIRNGITMEQ